MNSLASKVPFGRPSSRVLLTVRFSNRAALARGFSTSLDNTIKLVNPATEEVCVFEEEKDTKASIASKFNKLHSAVHSSTDGKLEEWKNSLEGRRAAIKKFNSLLEQHKDEGARALTQDMGKPLSQAQGEISATFKTRIPFFIDNVENVLKDDVVTDQPKLREVIKREPLGVIANVSAWNYPYFVGTNVHIPALLTGNAVLYKPSEFALRTGRFITQLLWEAGVPKDFFQPIYGDGATGAELLNHPVNGVFFTGSVATGQKINQAVATRLPKVQLELGGKDPTYVCPDADVESAAASLADGAMYNAGQSCCSVERIYVHADAYDKFVEKFVSVVDGFSLGDPMDSSTYIGPLVQARQLDFLESQVKDAVGKGAKLLRGGKRVAKSARSKGFFFEPTVLVNVDHSMDVMKDESFGPIIGIQKVKSEEEAVRLMNDTRYGLTAGVFTKDKDTALRVMRQVNSGTAYWNCCDRVAAKLPWSGRNLSGVGLTLSLEGIRTFTHPKAYHLVG